MTERYTTGVDMWRDYATRYGEIEARIICNRYLNLQVNTQDPEEIAFCRDLYTVMKNTPLGSMKLKDKLENAKQKVLSQKTKKLYKKAKEIE